MNLVNENRLMDQNNNSRLNCSDTVEEEDEVQLTSLSFNEYTDEDELKFVDKV
jgi:hypothetical protein